MGGRAHLVDEIAPLFYGTCDSEKSAAAGEKTGQRGVDHVLPRNLVLTR